MNCGQALIDKMFVFLSCTQLHKHKMYRICGIIGESNIWQFALKMQLARFLIGIFSTVWKETHSYSLNGIHLINTVYRIRGIFSGGFNLVVWRESLKYRQVITSISH